MIPAHLARHALFLLRSHPEISDRWGYHVRPIHYYEPLPDFRAITETQLQRRRTYPAINLNWDKQLNLISELGRNYRGELAELAGSEGQKGFDFRNDYFAGFDAAVYYALIRHLKPARVIEIGSGYSTRIADQALARNRQEGHPGRLTCVEPYPQLRLTEARLNVELIEKPVEEMDLDFFADLGTNDILFIDSSHTVKFGGDVCREFLEILPSLKPGVWVHVHDIFFPHDYPAEWLIRQRVAFNEQYLLEAFLSFNREFAVSLSNYWLCLDYASRASELWPAAANSSRAGALGGSSFWFYKRDHSDSPEDSFSD